MLHKRTVLTIDALNILLHRAFACSVIYNIQFKWQMPISF